MHLAHDPVPTVPPRSFLDYRHPSGEVFDPLTVPPSSSNGTSSSSDGTTILDGSTAVFCPGRENENCSAGDKVRTDNIKGESVVIQGLFLADEFLVDHLGPYLTVELSSSACPN
jgi:hypothetical protein